MRMMLAGMFILFCPKHAKRQSSFLTNTVVIFTTSTHVLWDILMPICAAMGTVVLREVF